MNAEAIRETGNVIVASAYQAVADKAGVSYAEAVALVNSDETVADYWLALVRASVENLPRVLGEVYDELRAAA